MKDIHNFLLVTFKFHRHEWKGTIVKQKEDREEQNRLLVAG